jgi:predicted ATP-binding protein involved in virulence
MRLLEISVHGLLKRFTYPITLHTSERITIIHGPNGYGKTTLLRLINSFYAGAYDEVMTIPFEKLELVFEGGMRLVLAKRTVTMPEPEQGDSATKPTLMCEMYSGKTQVHSDRLKAAERMLPIR